MDLTPGVGARALLALALGLATCLPARAQEAFPAGAGPYDPEVPTVASLRGFPTGATFSTAAEIGRVLDGIAAGSDRLRLQTYGRSVEGRPLTLAWVSSPANLARLDSLRAANVAAMRGGAIDLADHPIFVWLSFGVHGDEAGAPEAALELLYHLAAARDSVTARWLDRAVIAIDPLLNPDGHARYVTWYRSVMGPRPDPHPNAREHRPPWPSGRTNHWYFDLNRDWAWGVMPETRARLAVYLATLPQVHVDFHEMDAGSTYFFFPAAAPVHGFFPPSTAEWGRIFGAANAASFDARGWPYYTEEEFDLYYPGYGDSWPSFFGATGMTYEQAGGPDAGVALDRQGMERLTLASRALHHYQAALTTIGTAVEHRSSRLSDFADFWTPTGRSADGAPAAYLLPSSRDAAVLAGLLRRQGLRVDTLAAPLASRGFAPYSGSPAAPDSFPAGSFFVPGDQPLARYLAALMAPVGSPPDTSTFYDITGWALPYLYDVPAYLTQRPPEATSGAWSPPEEPIGRLRRAGGEGDGGPIVHVWEYASPEDALAAARLLARGYRVRVAERPFRLAGRSWRAGTFVVAAADQPDSLADGIGGAIAEAGARPVPAGTFRTTEGIDLGSERLRPLRTPRVALVAGPAVDEASLGAAWFLFAEEAGIELDVVRLEDLAADPAAASDSLAGRGLVAVDLSSYTAIVLPDAAGPDAYAAALGRVGRERLAAWVEAGGTLVGIRAGAAWLTADHSGIAEVALAEPPEPTDAERRAGHAARDRDEELRRIPGTLLSAAVDTTSVLGYGFSDGEAAVMAREPVEMELADGGNAWLYADRDPLAGYLPAEARRRLPGTPYGILAPRGRGHAVLLAGDPGFRGILHALKKLYLDAVVLVPGS